MFYESKIQKIDSTYAIILPEDILKSLNVVEGDRLYIHKINHGDFKLLSLSPTQKKQLQIAKNCMERYEDALSELAKL